MSGFNIVAHGRVGAIFSLEVSRLARSSADWHHLLDLCGLADVVIIDEQAIYTPRDYNDRLLRGLKGTMSEAELYWMRLRLHGGQISKARRGEYAFLPPAGYEWDSGSQRFRLDPDENVQRAVGLVFERFRIDGTARAVAAYFTRHGLQLPVRSPAERDLRWGPVRATLIGSMLHNPIYARAYAYGRNEHRLGLIEGQTRRRARKLAQHEWKVCLRDRHRGYISWDEFMANQDKLHQNRTNLKAHQRGAAREGTALLQGLAQLCGRCGHRMQHLEHRQSIIRLELQRRKSGKEHVLPADWKRTDLVEELTDLRRLHEALDARIAPLARALSEQGSVRWGPLMRAGSDKSHFARQVERRADIYMSRVSNLLLQTHSPSCALRERACRTIRRRTPSSVMASSTPTIRRRMDLCSRATIAVAPTKR